MGGKQSALKKEIAALQQEARKRAAKHQEELAITAKEKRQLQLKVDELQAIVAQAQEDAEKTKNEAHEREERMKALKWELVRQLRLTGSPISTSPRASLSPSSATRIALNWRLNDDVALRQSVVSPKKAPNDTTLASETRASLLSSRRSLVKGSEATAPAPAPIQVADADAKASAKTTTSVTPPNDSKGEDDPPQSFKPHLHNAERKNSGDDDPEPNDVLQFSKDDNSSS